MTLRARLALGFILIAAILFLPLGIVLRSIEQVEAVTDGLRTQEVSASLFLNEVSERVADLERAELGLYTLSDTNSLTATREAVTALRADAWKARRFELPELEQAIRRSTDRISRYAPLMLQAYDAKQTRVMDRISDTQLQPAIVDVGREVQHAQRTVSERAFEKVQEASTVVNEVKRVAALVVAGAGSLALLVAIWLTRTVARPVRDLERGMEAVAAGRFSHRLSINPSRDD